ncbi:FtsK/SpoIIIE domain-containing protein, partial [Streptomyces sp. URMC 123]|uniref:FtsK/SpoIIIE domain-containing protein n=1 Tax=Streptomyces sp. URMC 123 TaxID=3423403 RepID=UPI003F1C7AF0
EGPVTVVVLDGDPGHPALREAVARLAAHGAAAGIHVVCLTESPAASPLSPVAATYEAACATSAAFAECGAVALLSGDVATALRLLRPAGGPGRREPVDQGVPAAVDAVSAAWAERFARALAPLRAADSRTAHPTRAELPRSARLLDELGLARATPASLTARWAAAADPVAAGGREQVRTVLGAGPRGPLEIDLAAEGPHLLIEGAAGTGKTELLRSLAASLAAADRPDRLSLVVVDGGGMERGAGLRVCTDLPHVSTYLAASGPVRMREFAQALTSELKRRADLLGPCDFADRRALRAPAAAQVVAPRRAGEGRRGEGEPATGAAPRA